MTRKRDRSEPRQRISPTQTVSHLTDGSAYYAEFRQLMLDLGYEKVAVGFAKPDSQRSG